MNYDKIYEMKGLWPYRLPPPPFRIVLFNLEMWPLMDHGNQEKPTIIPLVATNIEVK